jgi:voltage-gated potassium channel Kch
MTEPEITNYELFILVLSVLSIVNLILLLVPLDPVVRTIILIMDFVFTAIFLADFFTRLTRARSKRAYCLGQGGWLDLLSSLPGLRIARVLRVVRVGRGVRRVGLRGLWHTFVRQRATSALLTTLLAGIIVLQYASIVVLIAERRSPDANIKTASDAVWWSYVTMTTVGYGDRFPVTNAGRIVGVVLMTLGVVCSACSLAFWPTPLSGQSKNKSKSHSRTPRKTPSTQGPQTQPATGYQARPPSLTPARHLLPHPWTSACGWTD